MKLNNNKRMMIYLLRCVAAIGRGDLDTSLLHDDLSVAYLDFYCGFQPDDDEQFGVDEENGMVRTKSMIRM